MDKEEMKKRTNLMKETDEIIAIVVSSIKTSRGGKR